MFENISYIDTYILRIIRALPSHDNSSDVACIFSVCKRSTHLIALGISLLTELYILIIMKAEQQFNKRPYLACAS